MTESQTLARSLWIGLVLLVAGRVLDLQWHASHDEFETARDQLQAHWVAWLGALGYAATAVWHRYEHSHHRDPDLPHVLLAVTQVLLLVSAPFAARAVSRQRVHAHDA